MGALNTLAINQAKELGQGFQPLFLFAFGWPDGSTLYVATHAVTYGGNVYQPRVVQGQIDMTQAIGPTGIDVPPTAKIGLADADKEMWAIEQARKFRGAVVVVTFVYYDVDSGQFSTDAIVPFLGKCDRPSVDDEQLTVTARFLLDPAVVNLPQFPFQQRCPKLFPSTAAQKAVADDPGSLYYPCGVTDPTKVSCDLTKVGCAANANSPRFGGLTYVIPPGSHSREYVTGNWLDLVSDQNLAKYGDYAAIVFGTVWVDLAAMGAFPDANSTRGEAVVCEGLVKAILKVTANDELLPAATDLSGATQLHVSDPLFRYNVINQGGRDGRTNGDVPWSNTGDPYGSLCAIEWVVYHSVTTGVPRLRALITGPDVHAYAQIDSIVGGVVTFAGNRPNRKCAGNPPFSVRIFGNSNPALNGTFNLSFWTYGPPGTVTLSGTAASGNGGFVEYLAPSEDYAWAILYVLRRCGLNLDDGWLELFNAASERFARMVNYTVEFAQTWASGVTYAAGEVVTWAGKNYVSLQDDNAGNEPDFDGTGGRPSTSLDWWAVTDAAPAVQPTGVTSQHEMFTCSAVIRQRRSASDVLTGLLRGCNSHLVRDPVTGRVGLFHRGSVADQQPAPVDGSNYNVLTAGGYPAYHFDESSIVRDQNGKSTFHRVDRAGSAVPNSVKIPFSNEDNDYSGDFASVADTDDIELMGQSIEGNLPVDGCNSLDRANRVGSIYLAEQIDGDTYEFQTTAKAVKLIVGHIIAVTVAKYGFNKQLMRVQQIAPTPNWARCTLTVTIHDDAWYADDFADSPSSRSTSPSTASLDRPPFAWLPNEVAPPANDALFGVTEKTFGLALQFVELADGWQPVALITGARPVNAPNTALRAPVLGSQGYTSNAGGTVPGTPVGGVAPMYFIAVASLDANGKPGPLSNPAQIPVAQVGNTNTLTARVDFLDTSGSGYAVYAGRNPNRLSRQDDTLHGVGTPSSVTLATLNEATEGAPDTVAATVRARIKRVYHCGPFAAQLSNVGTGTLEITGAGWPVNQWAGYDCQILWKADGTALEVLDFHIASNTPDTLTVTPDPAALGVAAGDLLGMLPKPTVAGLTLTDNNWRNTLSNAGAGLAVNAEVGRVVRFIAGAGRGYCYPIVSNTDVATTVQGPWIVTPDATSRFVIEDAGWLPDEAQGSGRNDDPAAPLALSVPVDNYRAAVLRCEVIVQDAAGAKASQGALNPTRLFWVPGRNFTQQDGYYDLVADGSGHVTVDLANGLNQRLVLDGTAFTILAPTFTGRALQPGDWVALYFDQDATGDRVPPTFTGSLGGYASDVGAQQFDGTPSTRSGFILTYHGDYWVLDSFTTGRAIT
ncbi:MAG TPA: phage tail protein [Candidatus Limnocylindrales bacterium]|nr:phage tail protein [Candidatus Limnocylindrales bacterium]